jgi:hypothetical protein
MFPYDVQSVCQLPVAAAACGFYGAVMRQLNYLYRKSQAGATAYHISRSCNEAFCLTPELAVNSVETFAMHRH